MTLPYATTLRIITQLNSVRGMARAKVTISMDSGLLKWMDKHLMDHYEYKDRSHFIEVLIRRYKDSLEKG